MLSACVPDGFSFHSLQRWVLWWLTDRQTTMRSAVREIDWKSEMLAGAVWSKQTAEQRWKMEIEAQRQTERGRETERGDAVSQSWEQIGLKVTTPSMRWFSTEGNGAWGLSRKKQFIAKPTEVWEIQNLRVSNIFWNILCCVRPVDFYLRPTVLWRNMLLSYGVVKAVKVAAKTLIYIAVLLYSCRNLTRVIITQ